jgi:hypothetical protein
MGLRMVHPHYGLFRPGGCSADANNSSVRLAGTQINTKTHKPCQVPHPIHQATWDGKLDERGRLRQHERWPMGLQGIRGG